MEHKEYTKKLIDENVADIHKLIQQKIDIWKEHVIFSDLWWVGVGLSVIPWIIWLIIRKMKAVTVFYLLVSLS